MSLSDLDVKQKYNANGVTTTFAIPQAIVDSDSDEVLVYVVDESAVDGNGDPKPTHTLQTEGALQDYTLTGSSPPTTPFNTTVEFNSAPGDGTGNIKVLIIRTLALTQPTDLNPTGAVNVAAIELSLDRLTAMMQGAFEKLGRALKFRISNTLQTDPLLCDLVTPTACLVVNDDADGVVEGPTTQQIADAEGFAEDAAASAAAALASETAAASSAATAASYAGQIYDDMFTGDGLDTTFDITPTPIDETGLFVFVDGSLQPSDSYSLAGQTVTFSEAPLNLSKIVIRTYQTFDSTALLAVQAAAEAAQAAAELAETNAAASAASAAAEAASISSSILHSITGSITSGQAATNVSGWTLDSSLYTSADYSIEVLRGTTIMGILTLAIYYLNGVWTLSEGPWNGTGDHGLTFTLSGTTTAQVKVAADATGNGTIKAKGIRFDV